MLTCAESLSKDVSKSHQSSPHFVYCGKLVQLVNIGQGATNWSCNCSRHQSIVIHAFGGACDVTDYCLCLLVSIGWCMLCRAARLANSHSTFPSSRICRLLPPMNFRGHLTDIIWEALREYRRTVSAVQFPRSTSWLRSRANQKLYHGECSLAPECHVISSGGARPTAFHDTAGWLRNEVQAQTCLVYRKEILCCIQ